MSPCSPGLLKRVEATGRTRRASPWGPPRDAAGRCHPSVGRRRPAAGQGVPVVGRPAAAQAGKPPTTSVARCQADGPQRVGGEAGRVALRAQDDDVDVVSGRLGQPRVASGSNRHSSTLRSTTSAPGTSPSRARWAAGRMSTSTRPAATRAAASGGVTRVIRLRASASSSSIERAPRGRASVGALTSPPPPARCRCAGGGPPRRCRCSCGAGPACRRAR